MMTRRVLFLLALPLRLPAGGDTAVRGRLIQTEAAPGIRTADGKTILLECDEATKAVLLDERLKNDDFEALGHFDATGKFVINPIYQRALFIYRGGKRLAVTYWCPICSIRTYSPGICVCCHEETELDPRDPSLKDTDPSTG